MKTQYIKTYGIQQKHSKRGVHSNKCLHFLKNISNKQPTLSLSKPEKVQTNLKISRRRGKNKD